MILNGHFILEVVVDDVENAADPKWVAAIDEFICPAVEATKLHLAMGEPVHQRTDVEFVQAAHDGEGGDATKCESSVGLAADDVWDSTLRCLGG